MHADRSRCGHDVRLFTDMHDQRVAFETNDRVDQGLEEIHNTPEFLSAGRVCVFRWAGALSVCVGGLRRGSIDSYELDQFVAASLIRGDDPLGAEVLQHPVVSVVRCADPVNSFEN